MMMADMLPGQRESVRSLHQAALAALDTDDFELIEIVPALWSGWECDSHAALVRMADGRCRLVVPDGVRMPGDGTVRQMLEERLRVYEAAAYETRRFLQVADEAGADD